MITIIPSLEKVQPLSGCTFYFLILAVRNLYPRYGDSRDSVVYYPHEQLQAEAPRRGAERSSAAAAAGRGYSRRRREAPAGRFLLCNTLQKGV